MGMMMTNASETRDPNQAKIGAIGAKPRSRRVVQFSIVFMLMITMIAAQAIAGVVYALQLMPVKDELIAYFSIKINIGSDADGHDAHFYFILYTLTAPLLLAGGLSIAVSVRRWFAHFSA
jgi:hypothetical protein